MRAPLPGERDVLGPRGHFFVRRAAEPMNQASQSALVQEPGADAWSVERMNASQVDPAFSQRVQHPAG